MKQFSFILLLLILLVIVSSCYHEEVVPPYCPEKVYFGEFHMLESSKSFFPYNENQTKIVLSDSMGVEYTANIFDYDFGIGTASSSLDNPCEADSTQISQYTFDYEQNRIAAEIDSFGIKFYCSLHVSVTPPNSDRPIYLIDGLSLYLRMPNSMNMPPDQLWITVDTRTHPHATKNIPDSEIFTIHGKAFEDVYHTSYNDDRINIFYTEIEGLVAIETKDKSISLKFERIE